MTVEIRALGVEDRPWLLGVLEGWGGTTMVSRGRVHDLRDAPGFVALVAGARAGVATYQVAGDECEVTLLESLREGVGVGTALLAAVADAARGAGCRRLWLITTNDNTHALRFYQRRDLRLVAVHRDAVTAARRLKPTIPPLGNDGIPIRDEIELELAL
jgi:ribosomal protein S18 acetylase RimI-like enzyme